MEHYFNHGQIWIKHVRKVDEESGLGVGTGEGEKKVL